MKALTGLQSSSTYFCINPIVIHEKNIIPRCSYNFAACNPKEPNTPDTPDANAPKSMSYSIISTYPHDTSSYTQGLLFYKGELYEGTGNYGFSKLKKVDLKTGNSTKRNCTG